MTRFKIERATLANMIGSCPEYIALFSPIRTTRWPTSSALTRSSFLTKRTKRHGRTSRKASPRSRRSATTTTWRSTRYTGSGSDARLAWWRGLLVAVTMGIRSSASFKQVLGKRRLSEQIKIKFLWLTFFYLNYWFYFWFNFIFKYFKIIFVLFI